MNVWLFAQARLFNLYWKGWRISRQAVADGALGADAGLVGRRTALVGHHDRLPGVAHPLDERRRLVREFRCRDEVMGRYGLRLAARSWGGRCALQRSSFSSSFDRPKNRAAVMSSIASRPRF
jgi:hypothetical protein